MASNPPDLSETRHSPINMDPGEFRAAGHMLVDRIAQFLESVPSGSVTPSETAESVRKALGSDDLPHTGQPAEKLLENTADLLFNYSLFNAHPRFLGYITSSPSPIGALGDLLAATVNANVASWILSPMATEIEAQTILWLAEMIGYPRDCGGILVSGGNMANFVGFLAARQATASWNVREQGLREGTSQLTVYVSAKTHTWIDKAADLFGLGTSSIRWIDVDESERMRVEDLSEQITNDRAAGHHPFFVVGTAGTVGTGAIDPLHSIADLCQEEQIWFHVDGAYGALAAMIPDTPDDLQAIGRADSVALDPHKWLYSPLEAGCTLVKNRSHLRDAFSFRPEYYNFADSADSTEAIGSAESTKINFFEYGPQNSRGFRALKVWLGIKYVGKSGYQQLIGDDIKLARYLFQLVEAENELEAISCNLSITTFRYLPSVDSGLDVQSDEVLNALNRKILNKVQHGGEAFVSNAIVNDAYVLRACVVNFRTTMDDITALPEIIIRAGRETVLEMLEES